MEVYIFTTDLRLEMYSRETYQRPGTIKNFLIRILSKFLLRSLLVVYLFWIQEAWIQILIRIVTTV